MKNILILIGVVLLHCSCSTPIMVVSDDLQKSGEAFVVKGKDGTRIKQKLSFGNYASTAIKRSWTKGFSTINGIGFGTPGQQDWVNIIGMEYIQRKQTINFSLQEQTLNSQVFCVSKFDAENLQVGKNPNSILNTAIDIFNLAGYSSDMYYVQIFTSGRDQRPWEMTLDNEASQAQPRKYIGILARSNQEYYSIVPITKIAVKGKQGNMLAGSIGFEFRNIEGMAVAAVTGMNKGMVFLAKLSAEERFLLANACAAILLRDVI